MKIVNLLFATMALVGASTAAKAEILNGYWHTDSNEQAAPLGRGHVIGIIVPDYSESHFVGFYMFCSPSSRVVVVSQDTGDPARPLNTRVPLLIDGRKTVLPARPEFNEAVDSWILDATIGYASPTARAIVAAKTLGLAGDPMTERLPTAKYQTVMDKWARNCGLR